MKYEEKILKRFDEIIELGDSVLASRYGPPPNVLGPDRVKGDVCYQWISSAQNLIKRVFGEDSPHIKNIEGEMKNCTNFTYAQRIHGVIKAAKNDYETDTLFELQDLITANLFEDFLEQAEILIAAKYYQPAAVIVGAILEDGLRKMCHKNNITLPERPKLDWMNSELVKKGEYNKLVQKNITAYADLRNNAAHGKWDEFTKDDVDDFLQWTRRFMSKCFN